MKRAPFIAGLGAAAAAPALAQSVTNLNVGTAVDSPTQLPLYVGLTHTFKDQGLSVSALGFRGDTEVAQALAGNSIDIALASSSGLLNLVTANQGVIGFYGGFNQADFSWLAQPAIKSWRDMKGKTLGVSTFGSLTDLITRYVLQRNHLVPDKDVQIIQAGGSPSAFQALRSGRLDAAILTSPFKWEAQDTGFTLLGTQAADVSPNWPKHFYMAKSALIAEKPQIITALLRGHVEAIRLARANKALAVQTLVDRLKFDPKYAERAYDEAMPDFDERGRIPERSMPVFWQLSIAQGIVKAPLPEKDLIDKHFIDTFNSWAPRG
jgi:ABC-type nitrate/sulfonate/bicarbonate transport system substrate-binding protein